MAVVTFLSDQTLATSRKSDHDDADPRVLDLNTQTIGLLQAFLDHDCGGCSEERRSVGVGFL